MTKTILGLDLGTNSIGWALVQQDFENKQGEILGMGSRIIPMSQDILGEFGRGNSISQTAERTGYRGVRRLRERHLLRRERLHRTLNILGFLPKHYANEIDFTKRFGKFINHAEPKLPYENGDFLFKKSFLEMLEDFKSNQPEFLKDKNGNNCLVPYDWTIYYLRKKALSQKIEKEELAWLILNFNQKRGYYQLRGEDFVEEKDKLFVKLKVDKVVDSGEKIKGNILHDVYFDNGWKYDRQIVKTEDWVGKTKEFIVTESFLKNGDIKRTYKAVDSEKDWIAIKSKTEQDIDNSNKTVGTYIYENLLLNPKQKIKGKLVRTIERKFYKEELNQILRKQQEFHPELQNEDLLQDCVRELYKHNEQHQQMLESKDFVHLFLNDIIFYQRPLRSQKSSISNCTLEKRTSKEGVVFPIKVISKSNPYYQEFRLLQWLQNLEIYRNEDDAKVTTEFITSVEDKEVLFHFLNSKKEVEQKHVIEFLLKQKSNNNKLPKGEAEKYRWNYVQDKKYPMNETRCLIQSKLDKVENVPNDFLSFENEMALWHIIYSVNDKIEYEKAIKKFALKHQLDEASFMESFKNFPPFKSDYGSFSEKAIKKLLPLMRFGKNWNFDCISAESKERIDKILTGEYDEKIKDRVREKAEQFNLTTENNFQNLPLWLAQYVVYGRHSESEITGKWNSVSDLENYLKEFKQHSLRNPIVEQVITETLRVVKDIWQQYGKGAQDFFSEIHIELGREMKNTADERKRLTNVVTENENTNLRIKALLAELALDSTIENVRPYSPMQQDILKIYEEGVLNSEENIDDDILKISKTAQPTKSELIRYKLWLEQKYQSPYTGQMIPLSRLFTPDYEIEHIIPQSRYFDDSMSNKVICESAVNKKKDNQLGFEFIKKHHGETVELGNGKSVRVLEVEAYESFVKKNYDKNRGKRNKLLLEDIPEKMIERQLNDTRYISKYISQLLSNIVRDVTPDSKDDGINSINVLPGNGKITARLKQDWGLNDVWNELILPRFERMNELTNSTDFTSTNTNGKVIPTVPLELSKGFSKKRIDHRHHAMDALVIACATRDHINLLNNESALAKKGSDKKEQNNYRFKIQGKLREKESYVDPKTGETKDKFVNFKKPWTQFTIEAKNVLENIVVSFKQNTRVINKATNYYENYKDENGNLRLDKNGKPKKDFVEQKGMNWAIRKSLHAPMPYGKKTYDFETLNIYENVGKREFIINEKIKQDVEAIYVKSNFKISETQKVLKKEPLVDENNNKIEFTDFRINTVKYRKRQPISKLSNRGQGGIKTYDDAVKYIYKVANIKLRDELLDYLLKCGNDIDVAFSAEGIEKFNDSRKYPVYRLPIAESGSGRFPLGDTNGTKHKFGEADKGTNLFFAIYNSVDFNERMYETIAFNEVISHQKMQFELKLEKSKQTLIPTKNILEKRRKPIEVNFLFSISPDDLVYVLKRDEIFNLKNIDVNRIYKMVSSTGGECHFVPNKYASPIQKNECGTNNKSERVMLFFNNNDLLGNDKKAMMIKENCIKLKVDRLGNISKA